MLKNIFKTTIIVVAISILTYSLCLVMVILNVLKFYELEEDYENNFLLYIFCFVISLLITFVFGLFLKLEKIEMIIVSSEMLLFNAASIIFSIQFLSANCFGFFTILKYIKYCIIKSDSTNNVLMKIISVILSTFLSLVVMKLGNIVNARIRKCDRADGSLSHR